MKRFLAVFSVLAAVALVSTGCNVAWTPSVAARVGGETISTSQLDGVLGAMKDDVSYLCASGYGTKPMTTGAGTGTWNEAFAENVLTQLIKFNVLQHLVDAHHVATPAAYLSVAKTQIESDLASTSAKGCPGEPTTALEDTGSVFETAIVQNQLNEDAYAAHLAGTSLQASALASYEAAHQETTYESCTSVIQLTSRATALKLEKAIRAGASFATEATRYSQNTSTGKGGVIGCELEQQWAAGLGPKVQALPVGVVSAPVSFQTDWLLFEVTKRVPEPVESLLGLIVNDELSNFGKQYAAAFAAAHVVVSPVYGTWELSISKSGIAVGIVAPSSKACGYALSKTAAGCATTTTTTVAPASSG